MKRLERARRDLEKAIEKRDQAKERLDAEELAVKECEAALTEAENNEYTGTLREWGISVEDLQAIRKALDKKSLAEILAMKGETDRNDEVKNAPKM